MIAHHNGLRNIVFGFFKQAAVVLNPQREARPCSVWHNIVCNTTDMWEWVKREKVQRASSPQAPRPVEHAPTGKTFRGVVNGFPVLSICTPFNNIWFKHSSSRYIKCWRFAQFLTKASAGVCLLGLVVIQNLLHGPGWSRCVWCHSHRSSTVYMSMFLYMKV